MLSLVMFRDMNRSEQESLYRTSRKLSLVPVSHHGNNAYEVANRRHSWVRDETPSGYSDDLVLSVLKSPINHIGLETRDTNCGLTPEDDEDDELEFAETPDDDDDAR